MTNIMLCTIRDQWEEEELVERERGPSNWFRRRSYLSSSC